MGVSLYIDTVTLHQRTVAAPEELGTHVLYALSERLFALLFFRLDTPVPSVVSDAKRFLP